MSKKPITINGNKCGDCIYFAYEGKCRLAHKEVGFFDAGCDDYQRSVPVDAATATKVCKTCGRELTLDHFGGHHRTADHLQASCKECMNAKIKKAAQASWDKRKDKKEKERKNELDEILDKAEPIPIQEPKVKYVPARDLDDYTPQELYDELKRRGWTGVLTKCETLS